MPSPKKLLTHCLRLHAHGNAATEPSSSHLIRSLAGGWLSCLTLRSFALISAENTPEEWKKFFKRVPLPRRLWEVARRINYKLYSKSEQVKASDSAALWNHLTFGRRAGLVPNRAQLSADADSWELGRCSAELVLDVKTRRMVISDLAPFLASRDIAR